MSPAWARIQTSQSRGELKLETRINRINLPGDLATYEYCIHVMRVCKYDKRSLSQVQ